jgi:cell division protein FtsN
MRLDYSEKRGARDSREVIDRKPVQKNRPRKEPIGMFALVSLVGMIVTFGAGLLTGWLLFKGPHKAPVAAAVAQPARKEEAAPAPADAGQPRPDAPLTFYKTLPAGGKGVIGSGMNLKKIEPVASAPHATPVAAPAAQVPAAAASAAAAPAATAQPAPDVKPQSSARFVVQVASYRDKQEADKAQAKLTGKGVAAYVLESKVADKGVWYRIRVGRHLSKAEADDVMAKVGKGAVLVQE